MQGGVRRQLSEIDFSKSTLLLDIVEDNMR